MRNFAFVNFYATLPSEPERTSWKLSIIWTMVLRYINPPVVFILNVNTYSLDFFF